MAILYTRIRLATKSDVSHIHKLIHQMSINQRHTHLFSATQDSLSSTLFKTPFKSPTVLLLEVSETLILPEPQSNPQFSPILKTVSPPSPIFDPEERDFRSGENEVVVAGFVLFFPNYASYLAREGLFVEDLFVRECYRRNGMGRMLMSAVAEKAAELEMGRVEWTVLNWNLDAVRFYEGMGAEIMEEDRVCRLSGENLRSYRSGAAGGGS